MESPGEPREPTIPTVPIVSLTSVRAVRQLDDAASTVGFFQIADHGVDPDVIDHMKRATDVFFALPLEEKLRWRSPSPDINRGYAAKGTEGLSYSIGVASPPDLFEAFNLGPDEVDPTSPLASTPFFAANIWPNEPPSLRPALVAYFAAVRALAHRLTARFAEALSLPSGFFEPFTDYSTDTLRVNHYERLRTDQEPDAGQFGMGAHTDYGIVTVLYADQVPGLQLLSAQNIWQDVQPEPGCFLINLGDLTAQWTNDRWRSTLHRVLPPPPGKTRRSVAFFHDGNYDALIECLPTCVSSERPTKYAPVKAGDHLMAKLLGPRTLSTSASAVDTVHDRLK
jgi:isopenicillin N synthase-like dioxygenase